METFFSATRLLKGRRLLRNARPYLTNHYVFSDTVPNLYLYLMLQRTTQLATLKFMLKLQSEIDDSVASTFIAMLTKQGKVSIPTVKRIRSCREVVICEVDDICIGVGAIKPATLKDFDNQHANIKGIGDKFEWELGYLYVEPQFRGYGISSTIVRLLMRDKGDEDLMASTELFSDNPMIKVLEKNGFRGYGSPWKSTQHDGLLGLFLRIRPRK